MSPFSFLLGPDSTLSPIQPKSYNRTMLSTTTSSFVTFGKKMDPRLLVELELSKSFQVMPVSFQAVSLFLFPIL
jgi:hypothetical protein